MTQPVEFSNRDIMTTAGKLSFKRVHWKERKKTSEGQKVEECVSWDHVQVLQRETRRTHVPNDFRWPSVRKQGWDPGKRGNFATKGNGKRTWLQHAEQEGMNYRAPFVAQLGVEMESAVIRPDLMLHFSSFTLTLNGGPQDVQGKSKSLIYLSFFLDIYKPKVATQKTFVAN